MATNADLINAGAMNGLRAYEFEIKVGRTLEKNVFFSENDCAAWEYLTGTILKDHYLLTGKKAKVVSLQLVKDDAS